MAHSPSTMSSPGDSEARFDSLDFLYMPSRDVVADLAFYRDVLGGEVVFAIEARFGIPHGPCAAVRTPGGQRLALYELTRPGADQRLEGRLDFGSAP